MSQMTSFFLLSSVLTCFLLPAQAQAQEKRADVRIAQKIALGRSLFRSDLLSGREGMNCATCHEPELSFADGQIESPGILGIGVGRNSPALWSVAKVKAFPGPDIDAGDPFARPKALSLAERCLVPIENPLEMASSVPAALERINSSKPLRASFERAFGKIIGGVDADRLAEVLAAYLESLAPPSSPYRAYIEGQKGALRPVELEGLKIFTGIGRCSKCHEGEALSDGLVHPVFTPDSDRANRQAERDLELTVDLGRRLGQDDFQVPETGIGRQFLERLRPRRAANNCDQMGGTTPGGQGGYGGGGPPPFPQFQTLSLWDVKRTGPYFRDGSESDLTAAIRRHVDELRAVSAQKGRIKKLHQSAIRATRGRVRPPLMPDWLARRDGSPASPTALSAGDIRALEAFLGSLSPRE